MSETIEIKKENAIKAFNEADASGKKLLLNLFENKILGNIMDRIKSFDDILREKGIYLNTEAKLDNFLRLQAFSDDEIAYRKVKFICEVLNEGWVPNWNNSDEYKYFPWFEVKADKYRPSGFGFSYADYVSWLTATVVGSRLCFKSSELALFAAKTFESIYIEFLLIK